LTSGESYTLVFDAWADATKVCRLYFYDTDGSPVTLNFDITLTTTAQTFSYTFTATETTTYQFLLCGGDTLTPWTVDNVSIKDARAAEYSIVPTDLSCSWVAADNPSLTISGHNHPSEAHASMGITVDISDVIPDSGFGVPSFGITLGVNSSPASATLTANIEHFDVNDSDGTHLHGENTEKVLCKLSMTFAGIPTTTDEATLESELKAYFLAEGTTIAHLNVTSTDKNDGNGEFDSFALVADFYV